uniref:Uncharacterized protein n=1 Tax=Physcomitrium patens TaxID=3218 RepID=A0A2K1KZU2_PHYPA|nr:hypothetical protein PHYPA_002096 [Physcomitrium patens]
MPDTRITQSCAPRLVRGADISFSFLVPCVATSREEMNVKSGTLPDQFRAIPTASHSNQRRLMSSTVRHSSRSFAVHNTHNAALQLMMPQLPQAILSRGHKGKQNKTKTKTNTCKVSSSRNPPFQQTINRLN